MRPRGRQVRNVRKDLECLLLLVVILVARVQCGFPTGCRISLLSGKGVCSKIPLGKSQEKGLSLAFLEWHSRAPSLVCRSPLGTPTSGGGASSRRLCSGSTPLCAAPKVPIIPMAEAKEPSRASYTLEWLLSHLTRDTFNYFDSIRDTFEDEEPTRETLERRLKMLNATRAYVEGETEALKDYGAFKQKLQRQIEVGHRKLLEQIQEETQEVLRQLDAFEGGDELHSQRSAASESFESGLENDETQGGQTQLADEGPLASEGIGSRVCLRELREALKAPNLTAETVQALLDKHAPKGAGKTSTLSSSSLMKRRIPAVLLAVDNLDGEISSPHVMKDQVSRAALCAEGPFALRVIKRIPFSLRDWSSAPSTCCPTRDFSRGNSLPSLQLFHFLKTEGAARCRLLLRTNRGVFRKDQALILHRQLSAQLEHQEHAQLMRQLAALREEMFPKLALIRERIAFLEKRIADQSAVGASLSDNKLTTQAKSASAKHSGKTGLEELRSALGKLRRREKATEEELHERQAALQDEALKRLHRSVRWLYKGFREHGSFRKRLLNQWKHRTEVGLAAPEFDWAQQQRLRTGKDNRVSMQVLPWFALSRMRGTSNSSKVL